MQYTDKQLVAFQETLLQIVKLYERVHRQRGRFFVVFYKKGFKEETIQKAWRLAEEEDTYWRLSKTPEELRYMLNVKLVVTLHREKLQLLNAEI